MSLSPTLFLARFPPRDYNVATGRCRNENPYRQDRQFTGDPHPQGLLEQTNLHGEVEISVRRGSLVISPDEMNRYVRTVVVAPLTTSGRPYPSRVEVRFADKEGQVVIDQLRTIDKVRLAKRLGVLDADEAASVLEVLKEFFAP